MIFDKLLMFANETTVAKAAATTVTSKIVDFRSTRLIDGELKVFGQIVGEVPATGAIATTVQVSDDGTTWTDLFASAQNGNTLIAAFLPPTHKRFMRLKFIVGDTALAADVKVTAGLVDQFDQYGIPDVTAFPPLGDDAAKGDSVTA